MEVQHQRCAGLDVHKETVAGCVRIGAGSEVSRDLKRFPTTTRGLLQLADWLRAAGCTAVAMEATGVYWKPVWHVLEGEFELVLANPAHIRNVPGRKSDMNDASWIADLLAHGLIRASFVPPPAIMELRDLTRTRKQLEREMVQHQQRIQKVLEDANLKLASVVSDVVGASGRRMIRALIAGETDPHKLAALGHPRLSASRETLAEALLGKVTPHHRFLLRQHLQVLEHLEQTVAEFEAQIEAALAPFRAAAERLMTIPGVSAIAAQVIIAEIGVDMRRFKTVGHLRSWAGLCPQLNESAGKGPLAQPAQRRPMAQDRVGAMRLGRHQEQAPQLSARTIPAPAGAARTQKSCARGRRFHSDRGLFPAPRPGPLSRPRRPSFHPPRPGSHRPAPGPPHP
jgi:transposase